jgi:hypothetical protein
MIAGWRDPQFARADGLQQRMQGRGIRDQRVRLNLVEPGNVLLQRIFHR